MSFSVFQVGWGKRTGWPLKPPAILGDCTEMQVSLLGSKHSSAGARHVFPNASGELCQGVEMYWSWSRELCQELEMYWRWSGEDFRLYLPPTRGYSFRHFFSAARTLKMGSVWFQDLPMPNLVLVAGWPSTREIILLLVFLNIFLSNFRVV